MFRQVMQSRVVLEVPLSAFRHRFLWLFSLALLATLSVPGPQAARADTLSFSGFSSEPRRLSVPEQEALGLTEITDTRDVTIGGQTQRLEIRYGGVPLTALLEAQGIGALDRYRLRSATILLIAKDGYRAAFSWGELFNSPAGRTVMVLTRENGAKQPAREGDFSLRAFSDLRPGPRHVRELSEVRLIWAP